MRLARSERKRSSSNAATSRLCDLPSATTWCTQLKSISVTPELPNASHAVPPVGTSASSSTMLAFAAWHGASAPRFGAQRSIPSSCSSPRTFSDSRTAWSPSTMPKSCEPRAGAGCCAIADATLRAASADCSTPEGGSGAHVRRRGAAVCAGVVCLRARAAADAVRRARRSAITASTGRRRSGACGIELSRSRTPSHAAAQTTGAVQRIVGVAASAASARRASRDRADP